MADHASHVKKYDAQADDRKIDAIVKYCGIALRNRDSSLVACSDKSELATVREGFAKKKLGLTDAAAVDAAMKKVCEAMKADHDKPRVTFYYLLAKETGTLDKLG
jgi:Protein of unknown function (DUF2853)